MDELRARLVAAGARCVVCLERTRRVVVWAAVDAVAAVEAAARTAGLVAQTATIGPLSGETILTYRRPDEDETTATAANAAVAGGVPETA